MRLLHRERRDIGVVYLYAALVGLLSLTLPLSVQMIVQLVQGGLFLQPVVLLIAFVVAGTLASGGISVAQMRSWRHCSSGSLRASRWNSPSRCPGCRSSGR